MKINLYFKTLKIMLLVQAETPMQPICMCDATQDENVFLWVIFGSFFNYLNDKKNTFLR